MCIARERRVFHDVLGVNRVKRRSGDVSIVLIGRELSLIAVHMITYPIAQLKAVLENFPDQRRGE